MPSSTSRHASFDRGLLAILFAGIAGAPLIWLTAIQTGYVLAYQACDDRSTGWVTIPTFGYLAVIVVLALLVARGKGRAHGEPLPMPFLGWVGLGIVGLMVIVMGATTIAPILLHPCD